MQKKKRKEKYCSRICGIYLISGVTVYWCRACMPAFYECVTLLVLHLTVRATEHFSARRHFLRNMKRTSISVSEPELDIAQRTILHLIEADVT